MWHTKTKDGYVYTTNDCLDIKIGKQDKKYSLRIAKHEANRRNINNDVKNIEFPKEDILKMTRYFSRKLVSRFKEEYKIKLDLEETKNMALYVYCSCQKYFIPGEVLFMTYFYKSLFRRVYEVYFRKNKRRKNNYKLITINDKVISKAKHSTLRQQEEKKVSVSVNLNVLPIHHRQIVIDHYLNEKSFQSIADGLGVTRQRIQQITKKCVERLRDQFEDEFEIANNDKDVVDN
jgi:RNA polymerase sigma factor (sigma-70 family)